MFTRSTSRSRTSSPVMWAAALAKSGWVMAAIRRRHCGVPSKAAQSRAIRTRGDARSMAGVGNRRIVDAQVHLWKAESPDWQWVPGVKPQLPEPFTIEKLVSLMDEADV